MVLPLVRKRMPMRPPRSAGWVNTPHLATSCSKSPGAPICRSTGCRSTAFPPSRAYLLIGWGNNHQRQWRAGQLELLAEIDRREGDVATMFANPKSPLFDEYGVAWLFVGEYESGDWRAECETAGPYDIAPLLGNLSLIGTRFRTGDTRIYRRIDG